MAHFYLDTYRAPDEHDDAFRPSGGDLVDEWYSIDLRPPGQAKGRAILRVDGDPLPPSPLRLYLGNDLDASVVPVRGKVGEHLGVDLGSARTVRHLIADLLIRHGNDARKDRWNQLKPDHHGWHRIWLKELVHESPNLAALSLSDNFNRGNNSDINVGAPVTWASNALTDEQIVSNALRNSGTNTGFRLLRAQSDLATADMFSQLTMFTTITISLSCGPSCRANATDLACYATTIQNNSQGYSVRRYDGTGSPTVLSTKTSAVTPTSGKVLRLEASGSTLTSLLDGGSDSIVVTDTVITSSKRAGLVHSGSSSSLRVGGDDWSAGDLGPATVNATLSATLGALSGSKTAVVTVPATLSASLGALGGSKTAVVTVPATLAATLGGLTSTAAGVPVEPATLAAPLGALTTTATAGPLTHPATLAAPLGGLTSAAAAVPVHPAMLAAPLGALNGSMTGTVTTGTTTVNGALDAPLGALTAGGSATVSEPAALAAPLGPLTTTASARVTEPATLSAPLGGLSAHETATPAHPAALSAPLGQLTAGVAGKVSVQATLHAGLGALVASAAAALTEPAALNAPLGPLQSAAAAVLVKAAVLQVILGPLTGQATGPITAFPPLVRTYVTDHRRTYATSNERSYATDHRRTYSH